MGHRTVVMLSNDDSSEWMNDKLLGQKISQAMYNPNYNMGYGSVVQCTHADEQSLVMLDGYDSFQVLSASMWNTTENNEVVTLKLLKEAANKLGYNLTKKSSKKV